jgi:hypothetical protein
MNQTDTELLVFLKRECETCAMIVPAVKELAAGRNPVTVFTQDDPDFPEGVAGLADDTSLAESDRCRIETVPTLIRLEKGKEAGRVAGWDRSEWRALSGIEELGADLPAFRPGCGAANAAPGMAETLAVRFGKIRLDSRRIVSSYMEDAVETCYSRGWTDGLPVVPPTEIRVVRMLAGTTRSPDAVVGEIPPNRMPCTVEKAAVNAAMAGCKPEYLPIVLAAVEAACLDAFCMHGLLATTYFSGPVIIVNGPVARAVGMNSGINVFGQGNRANATIGRALQLIIRNVGGGRPGEIDRATFGTPAKHGFCFAEEEAGSPWEPLSVERGFSPDASTVSLFAGGEVQGVFDQLSRSPESLCESFAACLRTVAHPKIPMAADAVLVVSPEHGRVFRDAGWSKADLKDGIHRRLQLPGSEISRGAGGIAEGVPPEFSEATLPKFRPEGLDVVHAGGTAGRFSAILAGWVASGPRGSQSVTREIRP